MWSILKDSSVQRLSCFFLSSSFFSLKTTLGWPCQPWFQTIFHITKFRHLSTNVAPLVSGRRTCASSKTKAEFVSWSSWEETGDACRFRLWLEAEVVTSLLTSLGFNADLAEKCLNSAASWIISFFSGDKTSMRKLN